MHTHVHAYLLKKKDDLLNSSVACNVIIQMLAEIACIHRHKVIASHKLHQAIFGINVVKPLTRTTPTRRITVDKYLSNFNER